MNYVRTKSLRPRFGDPLARIVTTPLDKLERLLQARALERQALAAHNQSAARWQHITVAVYENYFLMQDAMNRGNI